MRKRPVQLLIIFFIIKIINCLQVIPERFNVTFIDTKYILEQKMYIKRYGRKSRYYLNIEGITNHVWVNNITMHFIFNEFLHNEYRRSFIEFHYKFCDFLTKEPYIGGMVAKQGITCPLPVGQHHLMNMTTATEKFPNVFPFKKGRVDIEFTLTNTGESILKAYLVATFMDKKALL